MVAIRTQDNAALLCTTVMRGCVHYMGQDRSALGCPIGQGFSTWFAEIGVSNAGGATGHPISSPLGIDRYDTDKVECSRARGAIQDAIEFPVAPSRAIQNPPRWVPTIGVGVPAFRVENEEWSFTSEGRHSWAPPLSSVREY